MSKGQQSEGDPGSHEPVAEVVRLATRADQPKWWHERRGEEKAAAELLPELIDERVVDQVLVLADGTTRRWLDDDEEFRDRVVEGRRKLESTRDPDIDYARALTSKQIRAGVLLTEEEIPQIKVAEIVGVDERTIRNWLHRAAFKAYLEQLAERCAERLLAEAKAQQAAARADDRALRAKAVRVLGNRLDEGDTKAAGLVLKLMIDR